MDLSKTRVIPSNALESGGSAPAGRRYGGVDKDERQRQRRDKLIQAGLAVFGEKGFHAATVRNVCHHAELTSRYFYESFESMEALFEGVYVHVSSELMRRTVTALQASPMVPDLLAETALRAFLEYIREDPHRARVALIDALTVGAGASRISNESNKDFARLIATFIEMLYPTLAADTGLDPVYIGNGLVGSNIRIATVWVEEKCATPLEVVLRNMFAFYQASIGYADARLKEAQAKKAQPSA
jgi:AcrR family transcriptional regulator